MRTSAAKSEGKRLDRFVQAGVDQTMICVKWAAKARNSVGLAQRGPKPQANGPRRLDRRVMKGQHMREGVPLGECL